MNENQLNISNFNLFSQPRSLGGKKGGGSVAAYVRELREDTHAYPINDIAVPPEFECYG